MESVREGRDMSHYVNDLKKMKEKRMVRMKIKTKKNYISSLVVCLTNFSFWYSFYISSTAHSAAPAAGGGGSSLRLPTSFKTQHKSAKCNPSVQLIPLRVDYGAL